MQCEFPEAEEGDFSHLSLAQEKWNITERTFGDDGAERTFF
jgi:hypothetical protein